MNIHFEREKVKRNILAHGCEFTFVRPVKNNFGEYTGETTSVVTLNGLFHQSRGYISQSTGMEDGKVIRSKPQPMILVLFDEYSDLIFTEDTVIYKGTKYRVTGKNNINNLDISYDISLEMIDDGKK